MLSSLPVYVLAIFAVVSIAKGATFLHHGPLDPNQYSEIHGHFLSQPSSSSSVLERQATKFTIHHHRPLLLWDELDEERIHLKVIQKNILQVSGEKLDTGDFLKDVVIAINPNYLQKTKNDHARNVYLVIKEVSFSDDEPNTITVKTSEVSASTVISNIGFSIVTANIHPRVLINKKKLRRLHIYGRHGPFPRQKNIEMSAEDTRKNSEISQLTTSDICENNKLVGIQLICDIEFTGKILNYSKDISSRIVPNDPHFSTRNVLRQTSKQNINRLKAPSTVKNSLQPPNNVQEGTINVTIVTFAYGTFAINYLTKTYDLNISLQYDGNISSKVSCADPTGCRMSNFNDQENVKSFVDVLESSEQGIVAFLRDSKIQTDLDMNLYSSFRSSNSFKYALNQPFQVALQTQSRKAFTASTSVPSPTGDGFVGELGGSGPNGVIGSKFVSTFLFEESSSISRSNLDFNIGDRIRSTSCRYRAMQPKTGDNFKGACNTCHKKRLFIYPFMNNLKTKFVSTKASAQLQDSVIERKYIPSGKPLAICLIPVQCP